MPEDLLLFIITGIKNTSVCKTSILMQSKYFDTVQSQLTKCLALVACFACCSLGDAS